MTLQTITLRMPATLYRQVEQRARKAHRPVEDELVDVARLRCARRSPSDHTIRERCVCCKRLL